MGKNGGKNGDVLHFLAYTSWMSDSASERIINFCFITAILFFFLPPSMENLNLDYDDMLLICG